MTTFAQAIKQGIPNTLPPAKEFDPNVDHAPIRKDILTESEKLKAVQNALRYFPTSFHSELGPEFYQELISYGRIYMHRFRPDYEMYARGGLFVRILFNR